MISFSVFNLQILFLVVFVIFFGNAILNEAFSVSQEIVSKFKKYKFFKQVHPNSVLVAFQTSFL